MADDGVLETAEAPKPGEVRFQMRVSPEWVDHLKNVADYAAKRGLIQEETRGNMAAWVNYCLNYMERLLMQDFKQVGT